MRFLLAAVLVVLSCVPYALAPTAADAAATPIARAIATATLPCDTPGAASMSVYLPNITKTLGGPTGWQTPFIVQNVGQTPTTIEVAFYGFSDGALVTCRKIAAMAPATSFADVPNNDTDLPDNGQFGVVVRAFGGQIVAVVNEHQGVGAAAEALSYSGLSSGSTRVALPYVAKTAGGWLTTFIMQNLGTGQAHVTAAFASADGARTASLTRTIDPGRSAFVNPLVEPALQDGTEYAVVLTSDQPIAVVANAHNDAAGTSAPMAFSYNGVPTASATQPYLPYIARNTDGQSRTTRLLIENVGTTDATPTLSFQKLGGGGQSSVSAPAAVKAGRTWSFDVRFLADGLTACPPQGSSACVAEGEASLVVQGGTFAVLAAITSPTTAMGYVGATPAPSRVYLPNVTRTLGGPSGWTTPILVQSAGATAATLHWYRFSDGSLVQTQQLTGLVSGGAVRVDPRTVAGLSDDTQYAVVLDARAAVTAIVTELSAMGGDGAMAYEGFASAQTATPVPMTMAVAPASATVTGGKTQQFTATVQDQFAGALGSQVAWSVMPSSLGTINASGLFTAALVNGSGSVVATAGALSLAVPVAVQAPTTTTIGGISFRIAATTAAALYIESTISDADAQTITALVDPSVTFVQTDFGRTYTTAPAIFAFATDTSAASGWSSVLGASGSPLTGFAGVYIFESKKIALNWAGMKLALPYRTVRHELTHMMEHQLAGTGQIPTWFDEGFARLEDLSEPGGQYRILESRLQVASMAATHTLFGVTALTASQFYGATSLAEQLMYYEGAETVRLMRTDLGMPALVRILELVGQGQVFTSAYATVAGQPLTTFAAGLPARYAALAPAPGVGGAPDSFVGSGLTILVYGFAPGSTVTLTAVGPSTLTPKVSTINQYGWYETFLGATWPLGSYTVSATSGATTVSTTVAKTSSLPLAATLGGPDASDETPPDLLRE